jgi:uncharacterized SAM-binding protein YcdF (DUF218 family)
MYEDMTDAETVARDERPATPRRAGAHFVRPLTVVSIALGAAAATLIAGFLSFVDAVPKVERTEVDRADAIVALTGGAERLADAVALLDRGSAGRLLISGVNPGISEDELVRKVPRYARFAECCVDLDRRAANTLGNALETRRWVRDNGFRSVIVVTSGYHMPRALMELGRELPDVTLIPYPVVTARLREGAWWRDPDAARVMVSEYLKFVAAAAKLRLAPAVERLAPTAAAAVRT